MVVEKWEAAVPVLQKASQGDVETVCHLIAESICRDGPISADKFSSIWSIEEWWEVRQFITEVLKKAVGKSWTKEQISEELGSLKDDYKKVIIDTVAIHNLNMRQKLVHDTAAVSKTVLADFDWKLKLALSSDKLASLQEPLLQVDFDVRDANGERREINLELNRTELAKLITSLEGCSKSVQQLTTS
ncbi:comm domain-containing protein 8-like [Plakobranchus ocellatus]|uniref:Comm domain-containing protein 8-like n=1 Tax=Plakobranchus ocellatus TaxID=259542 RepID=A0AAV4DRL8_9GAST|nr:comm domain-containing protein 8-like [Plakobranchus ocellatus]